MSRTHFRAPSNQSLWNSGLILPKFCHFIKVFYPNFCHFLESRFLLTHKVVFSRHSFSGIWCIILFYLWKGKFQGLHESQGKTYFRVFRVMGKLLYEIQDFQDPLDSFQYFQGFLDILHLQDKLVSYFHSKSSTIWHPLTLDVSLYLFSEFSKTDNFKIMTIWMNKVSFFSKNQIYILRDISSYRIKNIWEYKNKLH